MGGTHAVFILMAINLAEIGRCFFSARSLLSSPTQDFLIDPAVDFSGPLQMLPDCQIEPDECWVRRRPGRAGAGWRQRRAYEWASEVRRQRMRWEHSYGSLSAEERWKWRPWVLIHCFSGPRRPGDLCSWFLAF